MSEPENKIEKVAGYLEGFDLAVRAAKIIKNLVADEIFVLSKISDSIDDFMNRDQEIKNAAVPDVSAMSHRPPFTYQSRTWNDFRDEWNAGMNSPVEIFAIANIDADGLHQIGCFKIIQDDCNDMMEVLKNAETLTSPLVESILRSISDVVGRYHYMCAYHGLKYRRGTPITVRNRSIGEESVRLAITVLERKCGGIAGYNVLAHGRKKLVVEAIAKELLLKSDKQVYNIIAKIRKLSSCG